MSTTSDLFAASAPPAESIRVGIGGWVYAPWRNNFYPAGLVQRRELEFASRQVTAIEINGTYYGAQKPATYAKWAAETPPGFVFSAKAPQRIVHARTLAKTAAQVGDFLDGLSALGDRLGPVVWQFDKGRTIDRDDFARFVEQLPPQANGRALRHVIDMRVPEAVDREFIALLRRHGLAAVYTDSPEHPSFADVTATDFVYARLMRSRSEVPTGYTAAELDAWAGRARTWAAGGEPEELPRVDPAPAPRRAREAFVFFIAAAKERNPAAAMALLQRLRG
ncbi:MAG TPA: DUF72 domain-containing protein [Lysobacter sp.]|nr:DUF72 domain-containing protein [Lysobacter sp.]